MYVSLFCPHLEYVSQIWNTHKTGEIKTLESVQKFALRMCAKQWSSSYEDLLQLFSQPSLQRRRVYLDLSIVFKIVHGQFYFPADNFVKQASRVTRSQYYQSFVCTQVTSIIPLYFVLLLTGIHFLHMLPWLVFLYHYLRLIFGQN